MIHEHVPETFTADFVGEPGRRIFYLQARFGEEVLSFLVEKEQAAMLAERLRALLIVADPNDTVSGTQPARDPALALEAPVEPVGRVGNLGIGFLEESDRVLVVVEIAGDEAEGTDEFRFVLRRDQVRALVLHALAVVGEGRPICPLCGLPMDPAGHLCPASNGSRAGA